MADTIQVNIAMAPAARTVLAQSLQLPAGSTLRDALVHCTLAPVQQWLQQGADSHTYQHSIWGRKAALDQPLRADDRIELCRALQVDPKVARRERFASQGAKTAGLFARRRAGAKPGY